jgi:asparagine synthase (glutamine-hydrolysing)
MPGIVGLVTRMPPERAERELRRMIGALGHEPFYRTGTWVDRYRGVYVGWTARTSSFAQGMPVWNDRKDVILIFSGEEFPEPGTVARRQRHRRSSNPEGSANPEGPAYLVHAYEEDPSFPAGLNGRFHGLLTDCRRGTTTLFNDRYGMHRLYYHQGKEAFYFAAEAKAILAARPELRRADARGLGELVACGSVLENRTVFDAIHLLPCAAAWVFRGGAVDEKRTYFQPREWEDQAPLEPEAYYEEIRDIFSRNLPRYFGGCERIGASLTGGLDTRMVMAWQQCPPASLPCYTFGGAHRDSQDVIIGRQVAQACGQSHEVIPVGKEFLSRFSHYAERTVYLTDGCADVSRSADLYVNERAREIAPIRMTGLYGGEVLRRVRAFKPVRPRGGVFRPEFDSRIREAEDTYAGITRGHPLSFAVFRQCPWHYYGILALEQTQLTLRSPYLDNDFVKTVYRAPESVLASNDLSLRLIADGHAALGRLRTDRGLGGAGGPLLAGVSRAVLEFLFKAEYAYDYGMPQWVASVDHRLARLHLERLFLGRHKFYHFRAWYRGPLSAYVRDVLLDPRSLSRPYIDRHRLEAVVHGHLKGNRNYTIEIHKAITLELLHRSFLDSR